MDLDGFFEREFTKHAEPVGLKKARLQGLFEQLVAACYTTIKNNGKMRGLAIVPSASISRIQEMHFLLGRIQYGAQEQEPDLL